MASILLENVGVHFLLPEVVNTGLLKSVKDMTLGGKMQRAHGKVGVSALDGINLNLQDGDRLGIVGHNGAGKSTLLRVLSTILPPSSGKVRVEGHISALMSINLGMDGETSGYENIRSRARFMQRSEEEIQERMQDIADFSELGDYMGLPIKSYSSGMRVRLAFAIATAFQPDIMILDEWLSAGDKSFRDKAAKRMNELVENTSIICFASHNADMLKKICNKGIVINHGKIVFEGSIEEAAQYSC